MEIYQTREGIGMPAWSGGNLRSRSLFGHIQFFSALISKISRIIGYTRQIFLYMENAGIIRTYLEENTAFFN